MRAPIASDITSLDPPQIGAPAELLIGANVFDGLYRLDDNLKEVPAIAEGEPELSSNRLSYTFHLNPKARFGNGDPVTAGDVKFSWDRSVLAAIPQGAAYFFEPIAGLEDVLAGRSQHLAGVSAKDQHTIVVTLSRPAGYWLATLPTPFYWIVEQRVVQKGGDLTWWTTPNGLVGTGPFKMGAHVPGKSIDLVPVDNWWGGSTGALTKVHLEVVGDEATVEHEYESGAFDMIGFGMGMGEFNPGIPVYFMHSRTHARDVVVRPAFATIVVGFNNALGPFAGEAGKPGRLAFSQAIDRNELVRATTNGLGIPATGGVIARGFHGYLGDNQDPAARFDPKGAKATYQRWDPDGSKVRGLTYAFNSSPFNDPVARDLQKQWKANLGVDVKLQPMDSQTFYYKQGHGAFVLYRSGYSINLDTPADLFNNIFVGGGTAVGVVTGYHNPAFDALVQAANAKLPNEALPDYIRAGKIVAADVPIAPIYYAEIAYVIEPYVRGAGPPSAAAGSWSETRWTEIKILKH